VFASSTFKRDAITKAVDAKAFDPFRSVKLGEDATTGSISGISFVARSGPGGWRDGSLIANVATTRVSRITLGA